MYILRQATQADYNFLYNLFRATMKDYVAQTWGWDEAIQPGMFKDRFDPEHSQIVVVDGRDVGVLSMERRDDVLFIGNIQIMPEQQGHGLGTAIIKTILTQASREGIPVNLQVLKVNPARHLYERLGFVVTGETTTHYLMSTIRVSQV
jgi:GNAT superfamily N-acetyltransferase